MAQPLQSTWKQNINILIGIQEIYFQESHNFINQSENMFVCKDRNMMVYNYEIFIYSFFKNSRMFRYLFQFHVKHLCDIYIFLTHLLIFQYL